MVLAEDFGSGSTPGQSVSVWLMLIIAWVLPLIWMLRFCVRCCFFAYTHRTGVELLETTKRRAHMVSRAIPALQRSGWEPAADGAWTRFDDGDVIGNTAGDETKEAARHRALVYDRDGRAIEATVQATVEIRIGADPADESWEHVGDGWPSSSKSRMAPIVPPSNVRLDASALYIRQLEDELMRARHALVSSSSDDCRSAAPCSACSTAIAVGSAASQQGGQQSTTARYFIGTPPTRGVAFHASSPSTPNRTPGERELAV